MARTYSTAEAKRFKRTYQELYAKFNQLDSLCDRCREEVKTASAKIAAEESMELLRSIPVDELNRESGYRQGPAVSAVRRQRYQPRRRGRNQESRGRNRRYRAERREDPPERG